MGDAGTHRPLCPLGELALEEEGEAGAQVHDLLQVWEKGSGVDMEDLIELVLGESGSCLAVSARLIVFSAFPDRRDTPLVSLSDELEGKRAR